MRQLVLSNVMIHQLFGDKDFYPALPPGFDDLVGPGQEAYRQGLQLLTGNTEGLPKSANCGNCTDLGLILAGVVSSLGERLAIQQAENPASLAPLKAHIEMRARQPLKDVLLYYKTSKGVAFVRF